MAAEGDIVHGPVARRGNPLRGGFRERAEHDVGDALRGLHVAGGHRRGRLGVHHASRGRDHL